MKTRRRGPDPRHAFRDQLLLTPFGLLAAEDAGADQRPARLVPVKLRWLDDRDVEARAVVLAPSATIAEGAGHDAFGSRSRFIVNS